MHSQWFPRVAALLLLASCAAAQEAPLKLIQKISLPGVEGRIDHFAVDEKNGRLLVAALGNGSVEAIDLEKGQVTQRILGLPEPQGIAVAPDCSRVAVACGKDGSCRIYDAATLKQLAMVDLKDDADNVRYDATSRRFWVGYGDGGLAAIDPVTGQQLGHVTLRAHPESFQLEPSGDRIFVNVPKIRQVVVVNRTKAGIAAKWEIKDAASNFPMAVDQGNHRLLVACRKPATLLALNMSDGEVVASIPVAGDADDVFYDAPSRRIYVSGGEGFITVVRQNSPDAYQAEAKISTAPGARTCFFWPEKRRLYLAVPHRQEQKAEVWVYQTQGQP